MIPRLRQYFPYEASYDPDYDDMHKRYAIIIKLDSKDVVQHGTMNAAEPRELHM